MALKKAGFNRGPRLPFRKKEAEHKINQLITATEVRLTGDNVETAIYPIAEALKLADDQGLIWLKYHRTRFLRFVASSTIASFFMNRRRNKRKSNLRRNKPSLKISGLVRIQMTMIFSLN